MSAYKWRDVKELMKNRLPVRLPDFFIVSGSEDFYRKDILILCKNNNRISLYLFLVNGGNGKSAFTLELGWSMFNRPPQLQQRPNIFDLSEESLLLDEAVIRVNKIVTDPMDLFGGKKLKDVWIGYEDIKSADELVLVIESVIDVIEKYCFDCFDKVCKYKGIK